MCQQCPYNSKEYEEFAIGWLANKPYQRTYYKAGVGGTLYTCFKIYDEKMNELTLVTHLSAKKEDEIKLPEYSCHEGDAILVLIDTAIFANDYKCHVPNGSCGSQVAGSKWPSPKWSGSQMGARKTRFCEGMV